MVSCRLVCRMEETVRSLLQSQGVLDTADIMKSYKVNDPSLGMSAVSFTFMWISLFQSAAEPTSFITTIYLIKHRLFILTNN